MCAFSKDLTWATWPKARENFLELCNPIENFLELCNPIAYVKSCVGDPLEPAVGFAFSLLGMAHELVIKFHTCRHFI